MSSKKCFTLITGASSGIGLELAHEYAKNGHHLILTARSTNKLVELKNELQKKYKINIEVISLDLSKSGSALELHKEIKSRGLNLNGLVNNAGFGDHAEFSKSDLKKNLEMIQLNITTLTELTQLFVNELIANAPSKILNVASIAAFIPGPLMGVYYATKAYVLSFSEALNTELKEHKVSVTALCPGPTISGFQTTANFSNTSYIEKVKFPTSKEVAEYGYAATMNNTVVAVHGFMNRFMVFVARLIPRSLIRNAVFTLQKKRKS
jgi:short-subunit dehydrogenase